MRRTSLALLLGLAGFGLPAAAAPAPPASPSSAPDDPGARWAILRYDLRLDRPLNASEVVAVRASSDAFAQFAKATVARQENEQLARLRQSGEEGLATGRDGATEILFVAPDHAGPRLGSTLTSHQFTGRPPDAKQIVYFHASTDGSGRIASFDVLFSAAAEPETQQVVAFFRENLRIWARDDPNVPIETFGSLTVTPEGHLGYVLQW